MDMLGDPESEGIAGWLPDGKAFRIFDVEDFTKKILPKYFKRLKLFPSFKRRLNRWGFEKVRKGPDVGAYYHQFFIKGDYTLLLRMGCSDGPSKTTMRRNEDSKLTGAEEESGDDHSRGDAAPSRGMPGFRQRLPQGRDGSADPLVLGSQSNLVPHPFLPASAALLGAAAGSTPLSRDAAALRGRGLAMDPHAMLEQQRMMDRLLMMQSAEQHAALAGVGMGNLPPVSSSSLTAPVESSSILSRESDGSLMAQLMALRQHELVSQMEQAHMQQQLAALQFASRTDVPDEQHLAALLVAGSSVPVLDHRHLLHQYPPTASDLLMAPTALGAAASAHRSGGLLEDLERRRQQDLAILAAGGRSTVLPPPTSSGIDPAAYYSLTSGGVPMAVGRVGQKEEPAAPESSSSLLSSASLSERANRLRQQASVLRAAAAGHRRQTIPNVPLPPPTADGRLSMLDRSSASSSQEPAGTRGFARDAVGDESTATTTNVSASLGRKSGGAGKKDKNK